MALEIIRTKEVDETLAAAFARLLPQLSPALAVPSAEDWRRILSQENVALFRAQSDEGVVGMLTLVWYDVPSGRKAWIEDVVVDAAARGMGAGEALVRCAVAHAVQIDAKRVSLTSSPLRTAARTLYRKIGFEEYDTSVFVLKTEN